ncbi:MAG: hypothetical protein H6942_16110 [Candidatus Accumulibacter sp.]|uniref:ParB/Srx family N-terminal domain-containing protein n=1 Tax=Accumulibacter sp. TaxID=2053492 RepID=UPI001A0B75B6|nr:ParB/Srx family N-terminal domain-containing protein [Accumulibacter sp.]MBE2257795.1 hypothetical protein [Paracoccaceae bacterium]MCB1943829.1 ParB/Srx family N-terminal domain-containing protein [Accumulibacter sp.]MCP5250027.1 hypothetical protein [Accumulibacter sp.]
MRALTMMLSGLLMVGLTGAAEAKKGKDDKEHAIAECGKHTKVARPDDGIITLKEKKKRGCIIDVKDLHPTQSAVGMDAVECKAAKISGKEKKGKLQDYLMADNRWVPLVRGPGGVFYLTDHHHLSTAVWNADIKSKEKKVYAYLLDDWSDKSEAEFWKLMEDHHDVWLKNPAGQKIDPAQLPKSIGTLQDDPLRTLSAWVRGSCGYVKCDPPGAARDDDELTCEDKFHATATCAPATVYFLEFKWGAYLGNNPEVKAALAGDPTCSQQAPLNQECLDSQYDKMIKALPAAMAAAAAPEARQMLGDDAGYNPAVQTGIPQPKRCN